MKLAIFALLVLGAFAATPEKKAQTEDKKSEEETETAKKFKDLGNQTRKVTSGWKRYPHRQNRSNETAAAMQGKYSFAANPEKEETPAAGSKKEQDSETDKKFEDLGKETRNVTARWKRYPHRQNRSNETAAALRGEYRRFSDNKNVSFCGKKVPMKFRHLWKVHKQTEDDILGTPAKRNFNLFKATRGASALQKNAALRGMHPGEDSYAKQGSGGTQKLAEGGATGQVAGKEAFATVLKDGFWPVGCYTDVMLTSADKFGDEKDKYNDNAGVSIANYDNLVDDADKQAMTPTVCFEFCSTLPDMVFFGITEGRRCYCTPYFKPGPGNADKCDAVCAGDQTQMCGTTSGRSSVFEMHLCNE